MADLSSDLNLLQLAKNNVILKDTSGRNVHEHLAVTSLWFKGKTLEKPEKCPKRGHTDMWPTPLFAQQAK